eukprot:scaffold68563_cov31-Tisochrysis_lutea.AAC.5
MVAYIASPTSDPLPRSPSPSRRGAVKGTGRCLNRIGQAHACVRTGRMQQAASHGRAGGQRSPWAVRMRVGSHLEHAGHDVQHKVGADPV